MARLDYLDFDISFQLTDEGYAVRVINSPAGQTSEPFAFPFDQLELENFLLRLGQRRSPSRRIDSPEVAASKQFGGKLYDALFTGDVRAVLRSSIYEARKQDKGLRIRLRFPEAPELADLPWEFLYDDSVNRFLALSQQTPLVRYMDLPRAVRPLAVKPPLRVLVMIADASDFARLDVEREWQRLQEALSDLVEQGIVELVRLDRATLLELQRLLRRETFHIFHFIGHGDFDERTDQGYLVLETAEGRGQLVSGQDLGVILFDHSSLRLAILNACEGGQASPSDPFAGAAQSLVQQGIPAVIAMQFEITDAAAMVFAHEFYLSLADGLPVDAALAESRRAIFATNMGTEWGVPVLFMRTGDGKLFDVTALPPVSHGRDELSQQVKAIAADAQAPLPPAEDEPVPQIAQSQSEQPASPSPSQLQSEPVPITPRSAVPASEPSQPQQASHRAGSFMRRRNVFAVLGVFLIVAVVFAFVSGRDADNLSGVPPATTTIAQGAQGKGAVDVVATETPTPTRTPVSTATPTTGAEPGDAGAAVLPSTSTPTVTPTFTPPPPSATPTSSPTFTPAALVDTTQWYRIVNLALGKERSLDSGERDVVFGPTGSWSGQYWRFTDLGDGYYRLNNQFQGAARSLDMSADSDTPFLGDSANFTGQQWSLHPADVPGYFEVKNRFIGSDYTLTADANGNIFMAIATNGAGQKWKLTPIGSIDSAVEDDLSGTYRIQVVASGLYWHEDGGGDQLVSTRYQPDDDFTHFVLEKQADGSYRIRVKADNLYLHEDGWGDQLISTRAQEEDDFTRFYFESQENGSYRIRVKATDRYLHEDGLEDQLISTRYQEEDDFTRFWLIPVADE